MGTGIRGRREQIIERRKREKGRALHAALSLPRPKGRGFPRKLMTELQLLVQKLIEYPPGRSYETPEPAIIDTRPRAKRKKSTKGKSDDMSTSFRGGELKRLRERHGLSRTEMARLIGINQKTYWCYETDQLGIPRYRYDKIIEMLGEDPKRG